MFTLSPLHNNQFVFALLIFINVNIETLKSHLLMFCKISFYA